MDAELTMADHFASMTIERTLRPCRVTLNGTPAEPAFARVSRVPLNRHWPGHQRSKDQTEIVPFWSFDWTGPTVVSIDCAFPFGSASVSPLSAGIGVEREGNRLSFTLARPGQFIVRFDGSRLGALHFFADKARELPDLSRPGTIRFTPGEHVIGRLELESGQTVWFDRGAVVYGELFAEGKENITVAGPGILDHSRAIPDEVAGDFVDPPRPSPLVFRYCRNLKISDLIVRDPLFLSVRPIGCENVEIDNLKIIGCWRYNSDGIDLVNCRHAKISDCFVRTFDDALCVKGFCSHLKNGPGGMYYKGKTYDECEDIVFERCVVWCDWGMALEVGIDLTARSVEHCAFLDCDVIHATHAVMDLRNVDQADVNGVTFSDIRVECGDTPPPLYQRTEETVYPADPAPYLPTLFNTDVFYESAYSDNPDERGRIRNITFRDIRVTAPAMPPSYFKGYGPGNETKNVRIENLTLNGEPITALADANITVGPFAEGIILK